MPIHGEPCILLLHAKPANHFEPLVSVSVETIAIANSEEIVKFTFVIVMDQPEPCWLWNKGFFCSSGSFKNNECKQIFFLFSAIVGP